MNWETFTKRTNFPKLGFIIKLLEDEFIPCRLNGESWHAPILEVESDYLDRAAEILDAPARKTYGLPVRHGVSLDDVPDDHPCFAEYADYRPDDSGDSESEWLAELNRGYAQDRI